jgi:phage shock protein PspC (stress-responsive transcriptional regulator)
MNDIRDTFRQQGLVRARHDRVLGGVLAGIGRRIGLDPWPTRLLFVLAVLVLPGAPVLIYPILWILMPREVEGESPVTPATSAPAV